MKNPKTKRLREMFEAPGLLVAPGAHDALTAKIIELVGFNVAFHTGYGTSATLLGAPDIGLVSFYEMVERVKYIAHAVNIPIFADGDTGYGSVVNVQRTVKEYIWAGASGMFIEDQLWPKRCGHLEGKELIPKDEMIAKIRAAHDTKMEEDPDFILGARTDAIAIEGFKSAIERANAYIDAGADFIFLDAPETEEQVRAIPHLVNAPSMLNLIEGGKTPIFSFKEIEDMGYKILAYPLTALYSATKAMITVLKSLKENGLSLKDEEKMVTFSEFSDIIGLFNFLEIEKKY